MIGYIRELIESGEDTYNSGGDRITSRGLAGPVKRDCWSGSGASARAVVDVRVQFSVRGSYLVHLRHLMGKGSQRPRHIMVLVEKLIVDR